MEIFALTAFAACITYAVIGNVIVGLVLLRKKIPVRFVWWGAPFYLYGVCNRASPPTGAALRAFALSTNIALILSIPLLIGLSALAPSAS